MGMFDDIKNELYCPFCGKKQKANSFQTKNFNCVLKSLDILKIKGENYNIYTSCYNCNNWIELHINSYNNVHVTKEGKKQIDKRKKEIQKLFKKGGK
jgi:hypothetical protein